MNTDLRFSDDATLQHYADTTYVGTFSDDGRKRKRPLYARMPDDSSPSRPKKQKTAASSLAATDLEKPQDAPPVTPTARTIKGIPRDDTIEAFLDGINNLKDWSSSAVAEQYRAIIEWRDRQGISMENIAPKYAALGYGKGGKGGIQNMHKLYNRHGKTFYEGKGLKWVTLGDRVAFLHRQKTGGLTQRAPKTALHSPTAEETDVYVEMAGLQYTPGKPQGRAPAPLNERSIVEDVVVTPQRRKAPAPKSAEKTTQAGAENQTEKTELPPSPSKDEKLHTLFAAITGRPRLAIAKKGRKKKMEAPSIELRPAEEVAPQSDIDRYNANRGSDDVLSFKCEAGDSIPGHPTRPVLDRQSVSQYSGYFQQLLRDEPETTVIKYHEQEACVAIGRFIACISPSIRSELPVFDLCEVEQNGGSNLMAVPIQWTAHELQSLYCFARYMDSDVVCDMILDRWHSELHQVGRQTRRESGELATFDLFDISPEFLNLLAQHDPKALDFFLDVIVAKRGVGWKLLNAHGLAKWDDGVKETLIKKLKTRKVGVVKEEDRDAFCRLYHNHHDREAECYRVGAVEAPAITASKLAENLSARMMRAVEAPNVYHFWWENQANDNWKTKRDSAGGYREEHAAKCLREEALHDQEDDMKSATIDFVMGVFATSSSDDATVEDDHVSSRPMEATRPRREPAPGRIQYGGKWGMVLDGYTNESRAIFDRKCRILEARAQRYGNAGIALGDIPGRERVRRALADNGVTQAELDKDMFDSDDEEQR